MALAKNGFAPSGKVSGQRSLFQKTPPKYTYRGPPPPTSSADKAMLGSAARLQKSAASRRSKLDMSPYASSMTDPYLSMRGRSAGVSRPFTHIAEGGDVPTLKYASQEFLQDLTPEAREFMMNVPTQVGKPLAWYLGMPGQTVAGLLSGHSLSEATQLPAATYGRGDGIDINPMMLEEDNLGWSRENLMPHELTHAWDDEQLRRLKESGETITGLPGILDWPRQFLTGGPGASALLEADMPEDIMEKMKSQYGGWLAPAERYTMLAQTSGFDPSQIPQEYQHLYEGMFTPESFKDVPPPPPETKPRLIDDLLKAQQMNMTWEQYMELREGIRKTLEESRRE